jgi:hypothetical protein
MATSPAAAALLAALAGCATAAWVTGCEKRISSQNIDQANKLQEAAQQRKSRWPGVSEGMTEKEVESILGQPTVRRPGLPVTINQPVKIDTVTYVYQQDGQTVELSFLDGKLQGKIPKFGENADATAPLKMKKAEGASISGGASGSAASEKPLFSREFRGALVERAKEEQEAIKAAAQDKEEPPAKEEPKKP